MRMMLIYNRYVWHGDACAYTQCVHCKCGIINTPSEIRNVYVLILVFLLDD
jgi:hypothetical protein